ncbi:hypothetical protein Cgig2_002582 [Carnegiea gigantea]|uniref:beta-N-acetylhexosaminidase n=1 Tax=Carnegiea gigantea TaxID=171969 RepID=A0A9Q1GPI6_9CARY|nr:hypothetical protein Cgig2_002582 [Carnegiea gigantea]
MQPATAAPPAAAFSVHLLLLLSTATVFSLSTPSSTDAVTYIWPLPASFTSGNATLSVDPDLSLSYPGDSAIISDAFQRYKSLIFKHATRVPGPSRLLRGPPFDVSVLQIIVHSTNEELQFGVDESYTLRIANRDGGSIVGAATIEKGGDSLVCFPLFGVTFEEEFSSSQQIFLRLFENFGNGSEIFIEMLDIQEGKMMSADFPPLAVLQANTVYGALRALETFSQLCTFDYGLKTVQIYEAPWYIQDEPRFAYRGLLIDTGRHYLPVDVIKQIIDSMSYAKLNVLHWHIVDEESFPLETSTYPYLWKGAFSKWERYTVEDAYDIVK